MTINNRATRLGETVDAAQGVVLDSVDEDKRVIIFRDRTGATVQKRY